MTPKSDHDEDMSMDEILASIRKFVTDNPHDDSHKPETSRRNRQESTALHPIRQESTALHPIRQDMESRHPQESRPSFPPPAVAQARPQVRNPYSVKDYGSVALPPQPLEPDVLELTNPLSPVPAATPSGMNPEMILGEPIAPVAKNTFVQPESVPLPSNTPSYALTASANSMSRLAKTAKSAQHKQTGSKIPDSQNITIEQLIRDMVRPFIKEWVEANLHVLVEEMVATEIKRITQHLE